MGFKPIAIDCQYSLPFCDAERQVYSYLHLFLNYECTPLICF
jgi:hypothetical protein